MIPLRYVTLRLVCALSVPRVVAPPAGHRMDLHPQSKRERSGHARTAGLLHVPVQTTLPRYRVASAPTLPTTQTTTRQRDQGVPPYDPASAAVPALLRFVPACSSAAATSGFPLR